MCGITGIVADKGAAALRDITAAMTKTLTHRGPDSDGAWVEDGVGLGHRRLSIIDLSPTGAQPMVSQSQQWVIAYNGEIYNAAEIRQELQALGYAFRGSSDTEVILESVDAWGVEAALHKINGMFAIALWDRKEKVLYLARDRLGIKPLYWGWQGSTFIFGSELKALRAVNDFQFQINQEALRDYFQYAYIPNPQSIYQDVHKLAPGHYLVLADGQDPKVACYWNLSDRVTEQIDRREHIDEVAALAEMDDLLNDAVKRRMVADVPLGVFLSGGVDSSTVAALMQANSNKPIKTYSIGFNEAAFNEAEYAKAVAGHLGTEHTELYVDTKTTQGVIPQLAQMYDEPFADSSQIPTYLLSKMTRQHVTVALSGDGGDEVFVGYNRYILGERHWHKLKRIPLPLRRVMAKIIRTIPPKFWDQVFSKFFKRFNAIRMQKVAGAVLRTAGSVTTQAGVQSASNRCCITIKRYDSLLTINGCSNSSGFAKRRTVACSIDSSSLIFKNCFG